jgi:fatty-acyl-CoA synthase
MKSNGLGSWIARRARMTPSKTALIFGDERRTYTEFNNRIIQLVHGLRSLGVQRGDRVGYLGSNRPEFLETMFAAATLGAVFVPVHVGFSAPDISYVINDSGCSILVYGPDAGPLIDEIRPDISVRCFISVHDNAGNDYSLGSLIIPQPLTPVEEEIGLDDLCMIAYTSGTTGRPKGAMLSHGNLTWNVVNVMSCTDYNEDDIFLVQAPLYRLGGLGMMALPGLFKGATLVVAHEKTGSTDILKLIERNRCSILFGSPEFYRNLLNSLEDNNADISSLRFCMCGGDIIPEPLIRAWLKRRVRFQQGYGQTEAAPLLLLLDKDEMLTKIGSSGKPPLFTDVRVVHPDMTDVQPGEAGEIIARGPNIMMGYWNLPDVTAAKITGDGWLRTGDAARTDDDGHIFVLGRVDDAIRIEGMLLFPAEIEKVLSGYPEVEDSAVAGIDRNGHVVLTAFVVLNPEMSVTVDELQKRLTGELPGDQIPGEIRFIDSIPRNPNGKIMRNKLQEQSDYLLTG